MMTIEPAFHFSDLRVLMPELWVLSMSCVVLLVSLFSRKWTYILAQLALVGAFIATVLNFNLPSLSLFDGMYLQNPVASLLKVFVYLSIGFIFLYSRAIDKQKVEYYSLGLFSTLGMMLLISAGHFMSFFLGLEILSLPLYAMVALDRNSTLAAEASMKYFVAGALASGLLLYGFSMLYGATNTLSFLSIAEKITHLPNHESLILIVGLVFVLSGILFKLGATPFHMWVPDVYQGSLTPVALFIGGAPKIAALGIIVRLLSQALPELHVEVQSILIFVSITSMLLGNFVAIVQTNFKRMLGYSSIAHIGYILLGAIAGDINGYAAAIFYVLVYVIMFVGVFGVLLLMSHEGIEIENITDLRGLNALSPWLAFIMLLMMFSMAGIPPLVGFFAKLGVLEALVKTHFVWLAALSLLFAVVGSYYYIAVIKVMYFEEPIIEKPLSLSVDARLALGVNGLAVLFLGLFPSGLISICRQVL